MIRPTMDRACRPVDWRPRPNRVAAFVFPGTSTRRRSDMRSGLALYLALRMTPDPSDPLTRRQTHRPRRPRRVVQKLASGIPAAFAVLRGTLRLPAHARSQPGTRVISSNGGSVGAVRAVVVALDTRRPLYAIDIEEGSRTRLVLVPSEHVARHRRHD